MAGLKSQPEFEAADDDATATATTTATKEKTVTTPTVDKEAIAAGIAAANAVTRAATNTAVGAPVQKVGFHPAFKDKDNVLDIGTVEDLALSMPRIKGEQGSFFLGQEDLGSEIQFEIFSYNARWAIGSGTNNAESKEHFRVSYDDKTIAGEGTLIEDYLNDLRAQGFSKAKKAPYLDIFGFVTWSKEKGEIPLESREMVMLQCSQTSLGAFKAFATTRGVLEARGMAKPTDVVTVTAMKRVKGDYKYTNYAFSSPKAR
jgi:hypothetical protein